MTVDDVSVVGSIDFEKTTLTVAVVVASVAPVVGTVRTICGGGGVAVVNDQATVDASGMPSAARIPVVSVAVYVVAGARVADGASVAVDVGSLYVTVPETAPDGPESVNVELVTVVGSIGRENCAVTAAPAATPVAFAVGVVAMTPGGAVSPVGTRYASAK